MTSRSIRFTMIHRNVEIGAGTWISSNVTIMEGTRIGKNCRIFPGAVISADPQDLKFDGEETCVQIGDNTTIREFVTIHRGTRDRWTTGVGRNCMILAYSHITFTTVLSVIIVSLAIILRLPGTWCLVTGSSPGRHVRHSPVREDRLPRFHRRHPSWKEKIPSPSFRQGEGNPSASRYLPWQDRDCVW